MNEVSFSSIEDYLKNFTLFDIHAIQLSSGKFRCQQRTLELPKLVIGEQFISTALQYRIILKQNYFCFIMPKGDLEISINGQKQRLKQPLVLTENQEMLIGIPDNFHYFYMLISADELAKSYGVGVVEENIKKLKKIVVQQHQNISAEVFIPSEDNQKHLCSLIELLLNRNQFLSYCAVLDIQKSILNILPKLLMSHSPQPRDKNIKKPTKLAIVNRALKHIHNNSSMNTTIPDLAKVSCCCVRNLEYAFNSILSISPKQYLIKRRLQLIHFALKNNEETPINEIIETFGVDNQGRFAQDYLKFYNEYPHQTRERISRL